tara:strand:- start:3120 stop:3506 length:387 start_codon:yes stop_codon:yes gene_type:complete
MKIKLSILPVAFDSSKNILDAKRNSILLDEKAKVISRYFLSENVEECIEKLSSEFIKYDTDWLDYNLADFYRISDKEFEVVYYCQFPYSAGFSIKGRMISLNDTDNLNSIGERYVRTLSKFTTTRFAF